MAGLTTGSPRVDFTDITKYIKHFQPYVDCVKAYLDEIEKLENQSKLAKSTQKVSLATAKTDDKTKSQNKTTKDTEKVENKSVTNSEKAADLKTVPSVPCENKYSALEVEDTPDGDRSTSSTETVPAKSPDTNARDAKPKLDIKKTTKSIPKKLLILIFKELIYLQTYLFL